MISFEFPVDIELHYIYSTCILYLCIFWCFINSWSTAIQIIAGNVFEVQIKHCLDTFWCWVWRVLSKIVIAFYYRGSGLIISNDLTVLTNSKSITLSDYMFLHKWNLDLCSDLTSLAYTYEGLKLLEILSYYNPYALFGIFISFFDIFANTNKRSFNWNKNVPNMSSTRHFCIKDIMYNGIWKSDISPIKNY